MIKVRSCCNTGIFHTFFCALLLIAAGEAVFSLPSSLEGVITEMDAETFPMITLLCLPVD